MVVKPELTKQAQKIVINNIPPCISGGLHILPQRVVLIRTETEATKDFPQLLQSSVLLIATLLVVCYLATYSNFLERMAIGKAS